MSGYPATSRKREHCDGCGRVIYPPRGEAHLCRRCRGGGEEVREALVSPPLLRRTGTQEGPDQTLYAATGLVFLRDPRTREYVVATTQGEVEYRTGRTRVDAAFRVFAEALGNSIQRLARDVLRVRDREVR